MAIDRNANCLQCACEFAGAITTGRFPVREELHRGIDGCIWLPVKAKCDARHFTGHADDRKTASDSQELAFCYTHGHPFHDHTNGLCRGRFRVFEIRGQLPNESRTRGAVAPQGLVSKGVGKLGGTGAVVQVFKHAKALTGISLQIDDAYVHADPRLPAAVLRDLVGETDLAPRQDRGAPLDARPRLAGLSCALLAGSIY